MLLEPAVGPCLCPRLHPDRWAYRIDRVFSIRYKAMVGPTVEGQQYREAPPCGCAETLISLPLQEHTAESLTILQGESSEQPEPSATTNSQSVSPITVTTSSFLICPIWRSSSILLLASSLITIVNTTAAMTATAAASRERTFRAREECRCGPGAQGIVAVQDEGVIWVPRALAVPGSWGPLPACRSAAPEPGRALWGAVFSAGKSQTNR